MISAQYSSVAGGIDQTGLIFQKASDIVSQALFLMGSHHSNLTNPDGSIPSVSNDYGSASTPVWANLFGKIDNCTCENCRSVFSPSAYMADLLEFIPENVRNSLV